MLGLLEIFYGILIALSVLYYYYKVKFDFWRKRGVPGPEPTLIFGTIKDVILRKITIAKYYKDIYDKYKDAPLIGIFNQTKPVLIIKDPEMIKDVFIKDAMVFLHRGLPYSKKAEPVLHNLFYMKGDEALSIRAKISSIFTPSKIKSTIPLLLQRSEIFKDWLDTLLLRKEEIDCCELAAKFTADLSATCLFGYDIKTIGSGENEILRCIRKYNKSDTWRNTLRTLLIDIAIFKKLYDFIGYYLFDNAETIQVGIRFFTDIVNYRKEHNIIRHDLTDVIMGLQQNEKLTGKTAEITDKYIAAQFLILFMAAYETSSVTISNTLYELALNHTIQDRLREEIKSVFTKNNEGLTFDDIHAMFYLDAVFKETLRKYPVAHFIQRQASSTYTFRNSQVTIPKNQIVSVLVHAINFDPEIYPNPEVYDPERFIGEAAQSGHSMHNLSFGHGLRNCIGERFGILQTKIALITFVQNYKIDASEKTQMNYSNEVLVQQATNIFLKMTKIK